jgi:DNA-binding winged helix-turn-helix (wHTH) protein
LVGSSALYQFGPFEVDVARRRLTRSAHDVHLTPKAFDLLVLLVQEAPRVLSKKEIHTRIWPDSFVSDATLVALVKELRRALHDRDRRSPLIRTAHSVGYAFAAHIDRSGRSALPAMNVSHWLLLNGRRIPLHEGLNAVGRDPDSDVWLNFASVSRHHARITVAEGTAHVEDAGSKNGTRVGTTAAHARVALEDGDVVAIGSIRVTYRTASSGLSTETAASATPSASHRRRR